MHKAADGMEHHLRIPLLRIADATAEAIKRHGINKVGLLGTKFTIEDDFYRGRLIDKHSLEIIVPDEQERQTVHDVIYDELYLGGIRQ